MEHGSWTAIRELRDLGRQKGGVSLISANPRAVNMNAFDQSIKRADHKWITDYLQGIYQAAMNTLAHPLQRKICADPLRLGQSPRSSSKHTPPVDTLNRDTAPTHGAQQPTLDQLVELRNRQTKVQTPRVHRDKLGQRWLREDAKLRASGCRTHGNWTPSIVSFGSPSFFQPLDSDHTCPDPTPVVQRPNHQRKPPKGTCADRENSNTTNRSSTIDPLKCLQLIKPHLQSGQRRTRHGPESNPRSTGQTCPVSPGNTTPRGPKSSWRPRRYVTETPLARHRTDKPTHGLLLPLSGLGCTSTSRAHRTTPSPHVCMQPRRL